MMQVRNMFPHTDFVKTIFKEMQVGEAVWVGFEREYVMNFCYHYYLLTFLFKDCDGRSTKQLPSYNQL